MSLNTSGLVAFNLENNRLVAEDVTPFWLADNISVIAINSSGKKLKALVFNCHGEIDEKGNFIRLIMGTGIAFDDLKHFKKIQNLVENIYIVACNAAAGPTGKRFCGELARVTKAIVFAGEQTQKQFGSDLQGILNGNAIDDFEGTVFQFGDSGQGKPVPAPQ